ncbi:MAG: hypothetical protein ACOH16_06345 [Propionibacteriaceae bacterium]
MDPADTPVVTIHPALDEFLSRDASVAAPDAEPAELAPTPKAAVSWESPDEESATSLQSADSPESADSSGSPESADSASSGDTADDADTIEIPAVVDEPTEHWLAERQAWFAETGDWPTEASDESVQLAATHPTRPYVAPDYPGLPAQSPAEVRARHGRGFSTHRRRRRKRHHGHEVEKRRVDIDLVALDAALDATETHVGEGLVDLVVWHTTTGLPLAARGVDPVTATLWHQASRDVRAMLPYADLPELGSYHLVGLADRRLAVLVHAGADLGACVTVDLTAVSVNDVMTIAIPRLHESLVAASREY